MFYKIKEIKTLDNCILLVTFESGIKKQYDVKQLFKKWKIFEKLLEDKELFQNVKVDIGGYGIYWNEDIDLSCNELWKNGIEI